MELASMDGINDVALEDIVPDDDADSVLVKVLQSDVRSMEATARLVDPSILMECARVIADCRTVNLYGVGASLLVAHDLQSKLERVDKVCRIQDDWHGQLLSARNLHSDDVAVVFSYSGLTEEMLIVARHARRHGATVIAVTRATQRFGGRVRFGPRRGVERAVGPQWGHGIADVPASGRGCPVCDVRDPRLRAVQPDHASEFQREKFERRCG